MKCCFQSRLAPLWVSVPPTVEENITNSQRILRRFILVCCGRQQDEHRWTPKDVCSKETCKVCGWHCSQSKMFNFFCQLTITRNSTLRAEAGTSFCWDYSFQQIESSQATVPPIPAQFVVPENSPSPRYNGLASTPLRWKVIIDFICQG